MVRHRLRDIGNARASIAKAKAHAYFPVKFEDRPFQRSSPAMNERVARQFASGRDQHRLSGIGEAHRGSNSSHGLTAPNDVTIVAYGQ
jgi:hypothetical protein